MVLRVGFLLFGLSRVLSDESRALLAPETDSPEFWTLADMWRDRSRFGVFSPRYEAKVAPKPGMDTMPQFLKQMGTARDARDRPRPRRPSDTGHAGQVMTANGQNQKKDRPSRSKPRKNRRPAAGHVGGLSAAAAPGLKLA